MKRVISVILCLVLFSSLLSIAAAAETDLSQYSISSGTVQASSFEDITAPCSGTLLSFDWNVGDTVAAGTQMFEMMTSAVTAPEECIVRYIFAEKGESADAASATYGGVVALEPVRLERIHATYYNAYNSEANKHLHVGQILYFKSGNEKGKGMVIHTDESGYEVEILTGNFNVGRTLDLYRKSNYNAKYRAGTGKVYKRDDICIAASGLLADIPVAVGDTVQKGDTLFTLLSPDADIGTVPSVSAQADGVVISVPVAPGQQVWKGQLLARISRTDSLEIVADVDEVDLGSLKVGDKVPVTLDTDRSRILTGTVTEISGLGITRQNAAYYSVHLTVDKQGLMLGQSASVYLPKH